MAVTIEQVRQIGYEDGQQAASESGSAQAPADGWDGWTINGIGFAEFAALIGAPLSDDEDEAYHDPAQHSSRDFWTPERTERARAYAAGAQAGADAAIQEAAGA